MQENSVLNILKEGGAIVLAGLSVTALAYALRCCMTTISNDLKHISEILIEVKVYLQKLNGGK